MYIQKALEARLQVITTTATVCITMLDLSLQNNLGKKKDLKITKYLKDYYILQRQEGITHFDLESKPLPLLDGGCV